MAQKPPTTTRRTDLDALRIVICASVVVAHAMLIFAPEPAYKCAEISPSATVAYEFMRVTTTPAFFVIAGWASITSLCGRTWGRFVSERVTRLLIPLVFGVVVFDCYWPFRPSRYHDGANYFYFALCFAFGAGLAAYLQPKVTPLFRYLADATMPVYVLHHLPLLLISLVVLPLALPVWPKIVLTSLLTILVSFAMCHWLVRPWRPVRRLIGMGGLRRSKPPAAGARDSMNGFDPPELWGMTA